MKNSAAAFDLCRLCFKGIHLAYALSLSISVSPTTSYDKPSTLWPWTDLDEAKVLATCLLTLLISPLHLIKEELSPFIDLKYKVVPESQTCSEYWTGDDVLLQSRYSADFVIILFSLVSQLRRSLCSLGLCYCLDALTLGMTLYFLCLQTLCPSWNLALVFSPHFICIKICRLFTSCARCIKFASY